MQGVVISIFYTRPPLFVSSRVGNFWRCRLSKLQKSAAGPEQDDMICLPIVSFLEDFFISLLIEEAWESAPSKSVFQETRRGRENTYLFGVSEKQREKSDVETAMRQGTNIT